MTKEEAIKKYCLPRMRKQNIQIVAGIFASIAIGMLTQLAAATNSLYFNGAVVKERSETASFVEPMTVEEATPLPAGGVEKEIRKIAKEQNFKFENYLVKLACCEGLMSPETENAKGNYPVGSIDRGLYGINNYWHKEVSDECAKDIHCSTEWTINRINAGYQYEWKCDKKIKNGYVADKRCL